MSDAASSSSQLDYELDQWDHMFGKLEQEWALEAQVSAILHEVNAAFAAQFMHPDAYKFADACDRLTKFLDFNTRLEYPDQSLVVQIIQVACAMHENAVNNASLSETERSAHYLASASLVPLCRSALEGSITETKLWCEVFSLTQRAEDALSNAAIALDLSKYLDFENMGDDSEFWNSTGPEASTPSPTAPTTPKLATPRASVHDIPDIRQTPRSIKLKERALVTLKDRPSKGAPLGRAHTMPCLSRRESISHGSPMGRAPSKPRGPRENGLGVLQETE